MAAEARHHNASEQAEAMADGVVTDREYRRIFSLFQECMARRHIPITEPIVSPMDGRTMLWELGDITGIPVKQVNAGQDECRSRFLAYIEASGVSQAPKPMDERLRRYVASCLAQRGHQVPSSARDLREVMRAVTGGDRAERADFDLVSPCVANGVLKLYPKLHGVGVVLPEDY